MDDKYVQQHPGHAAKSGTWVYDNKGKLVSVNGEPVPSDVKVYLPGYEPVLDEVVAETQEKESEG